MSWNKTILPEPFTKEREELETLKPGDKVQCTHWGELILQVGHVYTIKEIRWLGSKSLASVFLQEVEGQFYSSWFRKVILKRSKYRRIR